MSKFVDGFFDRAVKRGTWTKKEAERYKAWAYCRIGCSCHLKGGFCEGCGLIRCTKKRDRAPMRLRECREVGE
jgi:hypothetical protein